MQDFCFTLTMWDVKPINAKLLSPAIPVLP